MDDEIIKMDDKIIQELFAKQGQVIATLALRITTLEKLLLEKNIILENDLVDKTVELSKEFTRQTQEALKKATVSVKRDQV